MRRGRKLLRRDLVVMSRKDGIKTHRSPTLYHSLWVLKINWTKIDQH